ncbi:PQQ-like beta-propeller repeat protein [Myxococcaceae bacterium JPH2]|nr:PQQ-like beta-propeller repeat protein [Myxococcaceae bacterium JPH2]
MPVRQRGVIILGVIILVCAVAAWRWRAGDGRTQKDASPAVAPDAPGEARAPSASPGGRGAGGAGAASGSGSADAAEPAPARRDGVVAELGWGSGSGQLGRSRPREGNPEAPMSLAPTSRGGVVVLDQLNGRLMRLGADGGMVGTTRLTQQTPQDVTVAKDGTLLVLDRLRDKTVALLDPETGALKGELPLEGAGIRDTGGITGTFVDGDSVYVEKEHGALVRIGDLSGKADPTRPEIPGRPSRDGRSYLLARIIDARSGRVFVNAVDRQSGTRRYTREYRLQFPVMSLLLLDSDASGTVYLAVAGELPKAAGSAEGSPGVRLFCLDALDGKVLGQTDLPLTTMPEETFRDFVVLDEGGVLYQYRTEAGVSLRRANCH